MRERHVCVKRERARGCVGGEEVAEVTVATVPEDEVSFSVAASLSLSLSLSQSLSVAG